MKIVKFTLSIICAFIFSIGHTQVNLFQNGTFDVNYYGDVYIPYWKVCDTTQWNDVTSDLMFAPYNTSGQTVYPPDGSATLVKLRARGIYYTEHNPRHPRETREYLMQRLTKPLKSNTRYKFSAYLCFIENEWFIDSFEMHKAYPMKLNILVSNDSCLQDRLLMETPAISNSDWLKQEYTFNTYNEPFEYIRLQINWDDSIKPFHYNGMMLIDDVSLIEICKLDTIAEPTLDYEGDNITTIKPTLDGNSYEWLPSEAFVNNKIRNATLKYFVDSCSVRIINSNDCPTILRYNFRKDCETLKPKNVKDSVTLFYKKDAPTILNASVGTNFKYSWNNANCLSSDTISNPAVKCITDQEFLVNIKYGDSCDFTQKFSVRINCDILYPTKNSVLLDTLVVENSEVSLVTSAEGKSVSWSSTYISDFSNKPTITVDPEKKTTYTATITDTFGCTYSETFNISIKYRVPNFISPNNGDGINDCFHIEGIPDNTSVKIFDKSGRLIYSATNYNDNNCWQGQDNSGKWVDSGTYWYSIENKDFKKSQKGFVFLKQPNN